MIIKLHDTIQKEFEGLSRMPWPEYAQLCAEEHAESVAQDCERSGREPTAEELTALQNHYA